MYNYTVRIFRIDEQLTRFMRNADIFSDKEVMGSFINVVITTDYLDFERLQKSAGFVLITLGEIACWSILHVEYDNNIVKNTTQNTIRHPEICKVSDGKRCTYITEIESAVLLETPVG
jgi:glutamine amidotransferase-like uncharacterized protein